MVLSLVQFLPKNDILSSRPADDSGHYLTLGNGLPLLTGGAFYRGQLIRLERRVVVHISQLLQREHSNYKLPKHRHHDGQVSASVPPPLFVFQVSS